MEPQETNGTEQKTNGNGPLIGSVIIIIILILGGIYLWRTALHEKTQPPASSQDLSSL